MNVVASPLDLTSADGSPPSAVGGYTVLELVGRGGMGRVYRARHSTLGRIVAVKVLAGEPDERLLARFGDEARAVARLQHPNIAAIYESGQVDGRPFLVQEFVEAGSLAEALGGRPLEPDAAARIVGAVAHAVSHAHERGVLHRDLKPSNILLTRDGAPKVTDFGLAKLLATDDPVDATPVPLTRTGEILGTPAYMAPEQASGVVAEVGPAADVYALGAVLYESLTGRPPFQAPDPLQTLMMVLTMEPVAPRVLQPKVPRDLETICLKCLEKSPRRRYTSAAALADDLARARAGEPIVARPVGPAERAWKWSRRRPWQVAALGLVGLGFVALAVGLIWATGKNREVSRANARLAQSNGELREANAQLDRSRTQTESILAYALNAIDKYHFGFGAKLKDLPHGQALAVEVLDQASQTLDQLDELAPNRPQVWVYLIDGYRRLAVAQGKVGRLDQAARSYERARVVAAHLFEQNPRDARWQAEGAILGYEQAAVFERLGRPGDAAPLLAEGAKLAANLGATHGGELAVLKLNIMASLRAAQVAMGASDLGAVEVTYARMADSYRRLAQAEPNESSHLPAAIHWELMRTGILIERGDPATAERLIGSVRAALPSAKVADSPPIRRARAELDEAEAFLDGNQHRPEAADAAYRRAIARRTALAADFPATSSDRRWIIIDWQSLADIWRTAGRRDRAAACLAEARTVAVGLAASFPDDVQLGTLRDEVDRSLRELSSTASPP